MSSGDDIFKLDILAELERLARLFEEHDRMREAEATRQVATNMRGEDQSDSNSAS